MLKWNVRATPFKALEQFYTNQDPNIDTTKLFREASQNLTVMDSRDDCVMYYSNLMKRWNAIGQGTDYSPKKDF